MKFPNNDCGYCKPKEGPVVAKLFICRRTGFAGNRCQVALQCTGEINTCAQELSEELWTTYLGGYNSRQDDNPNCPHTGIDFGTMYEDNRIW